MPISKKQLSVVALSQRDVVAATTALAEALVQLEDAQRLHLRALQDSLEAGLKAAFTVGE